MILLRLNGDKVIGLVYDISPTYQPKDNEVVVESLPQLDLELNEKAYLFYINGKIEYKKEIRI